jgi:flavodoxin I
MKSLIVYSSKSGNTKKLADAAFDLLPGDKEIRSVSEAPEPGGYDLILVGFWLQAGKPDSATMEYLKKIGPTRLFLMATHGARADSAHAANAMGVARDLAGSADIVGTFNCQGEVSPQFLEKARKKKPPPPWIEDAGDAVHHPDKADIQALKERLCVSVF